MNNAKTTRKALLASVTALVICITMLMGTTFAWFTDTAKVAVNVIKSGTLDIKILDANGVELGAETNKRALEFVAEDGRAQDKILWEPGCTYNLETITIKNDGDLALQYKVVISGVTGDVKLYDKIEWTYDGFDIGTAYNLLPGESKDITISGFLPTDTDNTYMGLTVSGVTINVYATQFTHENDSTGNQYDANPEWPDNTEPDNVVADAGTADDLATLFSTVFDGTDKESYTITLTQNIAIEDGWTTFAVPNTATDIVIDGAGYTITGLDMPLITGLWGGYGTLTFKNLTIESANINGYNSATDAGGSMAAAGAFMAYADHATKIVLDNCHVVNSVISTSADYAGGLVGYSSANATEITNCSVTGTTVSAKKSAGAIIGHIGANVTIDTVTSTGNTITGNTANREWGVGAIFGRSNDGTVVTMKALTVSDNDITQNGATDAATSVYYGKSYGTTTLDGSAI